MAEKNRWITGSRERNLYLDASNVDHHEQIAILGKALSSVDRLRVLDILRGHSMSVVEVATRLNLPVSSVAFHFKCLEEANLIITESHPGVRGSMRIGLCCVRKVRVDVDTEMTQMSNQLFTYHMPIGNFFDCQISPTCGLADENGLIGKYDDVRSFYALERIKAQIIWFQYGYLEYRFPNPCRDKSSPSELGFSLELCSEAPGYQEKWPSDISFSINGHKVGTHRSSGDYGARRGLLTPAYWPMGSTQYGLLTNISVREHGGYINETNVNNHLTLADLELPELPYISLKIEAERDMEYTGGINIFGEKFGDHPQNIVMRLHCRSPLQEAEEE